MSTLDQQSETPLGKLLGTVEDSEGSPGQSEAPASPNLEHALVAKSEEEFSQIVERYSDYVYNIALRMTRDPHDAEDITQEVFLSAYKAYSSFRGQARVSTWLYRITVNSSLMKIRKGKTRDKYLTVTGYDDVVIRDWSNDPEKAAVNNELHRVLQEGLNRLPPDLRAAVILRDVHGFSSKEAADVLEITVPALKTRLHRGRVLLRKYLERYLARPTWASSGS